MTTDKAIGTCPYCKEEIKAAAVKCKHCSSKLAEKKPAHEGICPYCKETIHSEAIKCKHCKTNLTSASETDCGCQTSSQEEMSTILRQFRLDNSFIPAGDLKCALRYLDCIEGPLGRQPGMCEAIQTACRIGERVPSFSGGRFTSRI